MSNYIKTATGQYSIMKDKITAEFLRNRFEYKDGELYFKVTINRWYKKGEKAGRYRSKYFCVKIHGQQYFLKNVIYMMHYGCGLDEKIYHIDGNKFNNRIENLSLNPPSIQEVIKNNNQFKPNEINDKADLTPFPGKNPVAIPRWRLEQIITLFPESTMIDSSVLEWVAQCPVAIREKYEQ